VKKATRTKVIVAVALIAVVIIAAVAYENFFTGGSTQSQGINDVYYSQGPASSLTTTTTSSQQFTFTTSTTQTSSSFQTTSQLATTTPTEASTTQSSSGMGTFYLDVWVNYTDGSAGHLGVSAPLQPASITYSGHTVSAITVAYHMTLSASATTSSVILMAYENPPAGSPTTTFLNKAFSAMSGKARVNQSQLFEGQLLVWPQVAIQINGVKYGVALSPLTLVLTTSGASTTTTQVFVACSTPSTVSGQLWEGQTGPITTVSGSLVPQNTTFTANGMTFKTPGGKQGFATWWSYFFPTPYSYGPPSFAIGGQLQDSGLYATYNGQNGWMVSGYC
jgi:hypothetical protein